MNSLPKLTELFLTFSETSDILAHLRQFSFNFMFCREGCMICNLSYGHEGAVSYIFEQITNVSLHITKLNFL